MAKRKQSPAPVAEEHPHTPTNGSTVEHDSGELSAERLGELAAEVQAFMDRRDELASKLSLEIELTEKKLAELKRTAALLFPAGNMNGHADPARLEKKPKKVSLAKPSKPQPEADEASEAAEPKQHAVEAKHAEKKHPEKDHAEKQSSPIENAGEGLGGVDHHGNPS